MASNGNKPQVVGRGVGGKAFYSEAKYHQSAAYKAAQKARLRRAEARALSRGHPRGS